MLRTLPPSGAPIRFRDVLFALKGEIVRRDSVEAFRRKIANYLGHYNIFLLSSGKAALLITLKALCSISDRREVIIPAYSSFCLASAVAASGVHVKLCDMDPEYLDFDLRHLSSLVTERTLAVIPVHLFGLVARMDEVLAIAREKGAFVVEDAAQAAGAKYKGRYVGTIGDVGIFSLGRGKSVSTVQGGVIVAKNGHLSHILGSRVSKLSYPRPLAMVSMVLTAFAISIFLRPQLYLIPGSLPFLNLGANIYNSDFNVFNFSQFQAGIGNATLSRLDFYNENRRERARFLSESLRGIEEISLPKTIKDSCPCFTRFPILFNDPHLRERKFGQLEKAGLGVSKNYPWPLNEVVEFRCHVLNPNEAFTNSRRLSQSILTLPTHPFVRKEDLVRMVDLICR